MITMEMIGKIRRMHIRDRMSLNEIAKRTGLSRNTVKKWLKLTKVAVPKYRRREQPGKLTAFEEQLKLALEADGRRPKRDRRTARLLWAQVKDKGYIGWLDDSDMVAKRIARTRFLTCAAPAYWRAHGHPNDPSELARHPCLCFRTPWGVVLDLWKYQRDSEVRNVAVTARILSEDRAWTLDAAARGAGVVRVADLSAQPYIEHGFLEPALVEWQALEAPNVYVMYRRTSRTSARVRAFVDFVSGVFATLETSGPQAGGSAMSQGSTPAWFRTHWVGSLTRRPHS